MRFSHPAQVPRSSVQCSFPEFQQQRSVIVLCRHKCSSRVHYIADLDASRSSSPFFQELLASPDLHRRHTIPAHCNANTPKSFIRGFGLEASPDTCLCRAVSYRVTTRSPPDGSVRPRIAAAQPFPLASRPDLQILAWMPLPLHYFTLHFFVQVLAGAH